MKVCSLTPLWLGEYSAQTAAPPGLNSLYPELVQRLHGPLHVLSLDGEDEFRCVHHGHPLLSAKLRQIVLMLNFWKWTPWIAASHSDLRLDTVDLGIHLRFLVWHHGLQGSLQNKSPLEYGAQGEVKTVKSWNSSWRPGNYLWKEERKGDSWIRQVFHFEGFSY